MIKNVHDMFFLYIVKDKIEGRIERTVLTITDVLSNVGGYAEIIILIITFGIGGY